MKYNGKVGFVITRETSPGTWTPQTEVREVLGDVLLRNIRETDAQSINTNVDISQQISFVYDNFLIQNMFVMQWMEWMGKKFKISKIDVRPPRMIVTLGQSFGEEDDYDRTES